MPENAKLDAYVNAALEAPESDREISFFLNSGFDPLTRQWELILTYNGDIRKVAEELNAGLEILNYNFAIVTIDENRILDLAGYDEVEFIEMPRRLGQMLSYSMVSSCVTRVQSQYGLDGTGTILAIIDSGIDYMHPDFIREDGTSRILYIWDQTIQGNSPAPFLSGSEYNNEMINRALKAPTNEEALQIVPHQDYEGHGTHIAGIAGGNGRASSSDEKGVAFNADYIIVKMGRRGRDVYPYTTDLMRAIKYVIDKATSLRRPVAINISMGTNAGPHNGDSLFETYLNEMSLSWKNAIVVATGNEGDAGHHALGTLKMGEVLTTKFVTGPGLPSMAISIWSGFYDQFELEIITPSGASSGRLSPRTDRFQFGLGNVTLYVLFGQPTPYSSYQEIFVNIVSRSGNLGEGAWTINMYPKNIVEGVVNMWLPITEMVGRETRFLSPSVETTLTLPSSARNVISVGGYNSFQNSISSFSGRGYTTGNSMVKPDLVAPANNIYSTIPGGGYDVKSGTSVAAPHVTGAAALMMQWGIVQGNDPFMYGQKIKANLIAGASRQESLEFPNNSWGYGSLCLSNSFDIMEDMAKGFGIPIRQINNPEDIQMDQGIPQTGEASSPEENAVADPATPNSSSQPAAPSQTPVNNGPSETLDTSDPAPVDNEEVNQPQQIEPSDTGETGLPPADVPLENNNGPIEEDINTPIAESPLPGEVPLPGLQTEQPFPNTLNSNPEPHILSGPPYPVYSQEELELDNYKIVSNDYRDLVMLTDLDVNEYFGDKGFDFSCNSLDNLYYIVQVKDSEYDKFIAEFDDQTYFEEPVLYSLLDRGSLEAAEIINLHNQPNLTLRGQNVLVAIIDTGIDYTNPTFIHDDNTTKIMSIWDQTIQSTPPSEEFCYGTEYTEDDINHALQSENPFDIVPHRDESGHGSFMAQTAAGLGRGDSLGAAPDADLVIVKLKPAKPYLKEENLIFTDAQVYESTDIILAVKYILTKAYMLGMPVAICLPLGTNVGAHDGRSLLENYLDIVTNIKGVALCIAAGNEGAAQHHAMGTISDANQTANIEINVGENEKGFIMYVWANEPDIISVGMLSPSGESIERFPAKLNAKMERKLIFERTTISIEYVLAEYWSGNQMAKISFLDPTPGRWSITVYGDKIIDGTFHAWLPIGNWITSNTYFFQSSPQYTVTIPATTFSCLCVGAYNYIDQSYYIYSSRGPSADGRVLPTLVAPGVNIRGLFANNLEGSMSGTCVATAITTGACALLLEWGIVKGFDPYIDTVTLKAYFTRGARRQTGANYPNNQSGYGQLNVTNALMQVRSVEPDDVSGGYHFQWFKNEFDQYYVLPVKPLPN